MTREVVCIGRHDEPQEANIGHLCVKCFARLRSSLLELPEVAAWLEQNIAVGGVPGERVSGSRDDPIPLRVDVTDLIGPDSRSWPKSATKPQFLLWDAGVCVATFGSWREAERYWRDTMTTAGVPASVVAMLSKPFTRKEWLALSVEDREAMDEAHERWQIRPTEVGGSDQQGEDAFRAELFHWVRLVTEEQPEFAWPERCDLVVPLVEWLTGHLSWIAGQPWVDEFIDGVHHLTTQAHRIAPWRATIIRDRKPCETCGVAAIIVRLSEGRTVCEKAAGGCGRVIVWDHKAGQRYARDKPSPPAKTRINTGEAAALARVQPATIRSWARRGKLTEVGRDSNNRPLYGTADVVKVAQQQDETHMAG